MLKYLSLILVFSLFLPWGISQWYSGVVKHQIKKQVKQSIAAGLKKSELHFLKFSKSEIDEKVNWKHDGEFEFNGFMYDIVERDQSSDSLLFWCWLDKVETELNIKVKKLTELAFGENQQHHENKQKVNQFYQNLFCSDIHNISIQEPIIKEVQEFYFASFFPSGKLNVDSPPPELV